MDHREDQPSAALAPRIPLGLMAGAIAVFAAAAHLFVMRGAQPGSILLFGLPILIAYQNLKPPTTLAERISAGAFFAFLAIGAAVSRSQDVFPRLGGVGKGLAPQHERMLSWYVGLYLTFLFAVIPWQIFGRALKQHRRGEPAKYSRITCYLGLLASVLMTLMLPQALIRQGFWPIR